ncbi:TatD family hydrolase [bacterium]|nr:TatD family hydrolase [bacterium]
MIIDTHSHLNMAMFDPDLAEVLTRAEENGVSAVIDVGTDIPTSRKAAANASDPRVYAACGIHPHETSKAAPSDLEELRDLLGRPRTVALGEIGLDYHYDFSPPDVQKRWFTLQLKLARELKVPVIVHVREAMDDALKLIDAVSGDLWQGVFHCYGGTAEQAGMVLSRGFHISFTGVVTFRNFRAFDAVRSVPLNCMLLETDCPYMTPVPLRGKRNEPAFLPHIVERLAGIIEVSPAELARLTTENAVRLFGLDP